MFNLKYFDDGLSHCIKLALKRNGSEPSKGQTDVRYLQEELQGRESQK